VAVKAQHPPQQASDFVSQRDMGAEPCLVYVGLGANLGEREAALRHALKALGQCPGTRVLRVSPLYGSAPVDAGGPDYLNAVAELVTTLAPEALLQALQAIEQSAGRERPYRNAPRTLDLDILWFGDRVIDTPTLTVPHPRMAERAFVLRPLADLVPERVPESALARVAGQSIHRIADADGGHVPD
jgi:2-amino-4-hydroxy-6-hydroxymethyldihydropteridine diphosphokinase